VVYSTGKAGQGSVWLWMLKDTQGHYVIIRDLGGDFSIPSCNRLGSGVV
jgi:hypothetical protein